MPQQCRVCSHKDRFLIEKAILANTPNTRIARKYGMSDASVHYHAEHHLSRDLVKADENRKLLHGQSLLNNISELITRTKSILDDAESKDTTKWKNVSLGAIRELRQTYEFMIKFSLYMHEAQKAEERKAHEANLGDIKRLDLYELRLFEKLLNKINGKTDSDILRDLKDEMRLEARMFHSRFSDELDYTSRRKRVTDDKVFRRKEYSGDAEDEEEEVFYEDAVDGGDEISGAHESGDEKIKQSKWKRTPKPSPCPGEMNRSPRVSTLL